jgi:riboflavin synthase
MFSGIVECTGTIQSIRQEGSNLTFTISSPISGSTYIDQSIAHDGVCLTVVEQDSQTHTVTAIQETLEKTKLSQWQSGTILNLERSVQAGARMDGHFVQGHVDTVATCTGIDVLDGSWYFHFQTTPDHAAFMVDKGSICIDGVSLTLTSAKDGSFSVAIIPYTYLHTGFSRLAKGDVVNIEFDILGKYIVQYLKNLKQ